MKRKLRKYMICICAAVLLGVFPAEAGQETRLPPAAERSQPPGEEGEETEMPEPVEEGGETESSEPGEKGEETQVPESGEGGADEDATVQDEDGTVKKGLGGTSSLEPNSVPVPVSGENRENNEESGEQRETAEPFSRENLIKIGIGAAISAVVIGVGVFLWSRSAGKRKVQRQEEAQRQAAEKRQAEQQRARGQELKEREAARKRELEASAAEMKQGRMGGSDGTEFFEAGTPSMRMPAGLEANRGQAKADHLDTTRETIGKVHNVGRRRNQQDTVGTASTRLGVLAVVSDGMGGLSDGEKVSQKAVQGMLQAAGRVAVPGDENPLFMMLSEANEQVLKMLGPDQIYKSGATLLAVLVNNNRFHWVAVGDSRIYLYCSGHLFQINREHIYKQQLIAEAVNKNISFSRVNTDPQRDRLVSFLGMGELKWVDGSLRPVELKQGDKLLLMSDGIFNTISEEEIIRILENTRNAVDAAALMEQQVLAAGNPKQDNFTCVILDF